ncbi:unnamed protein product [Paramecium octaurelia]|uniref:Uncharacterized protein n=1 Tax=Paramecium octaurelia TaxID=43137 RepID=A0A8S1VVP2_PAROT|nr:unnamed protein product [Paramecium octaurelia]
MFKLGKDQSVKIKESLLRILKTKRQTILFRIQNLTIKSRIEKQQKQNLKQYCFKIQNLIQFKKTVTIDFINR